ncbi:MAG TPA: GNAT family protein [Solirubrobacteraceae bacterium]
MSQDHDGVPSFALGDGRALRPLEDDDATELHALIEANRPRLARWMAWAAGHETAAQTLEFIRSTQRQMAGNHGLQLALTVDRAIAGMVGFHAIDWQNRATSLGYWLAEEHEGRGTMTSAVRVLTQHAFGHWGLNRVEIRADIENERSRAIPERLGFRHEGTLRQSYRIAGERYSDDAVYAMLAADWPGAQRRETSSR